jgi:hypothetical protein
MKAIQIGAIAVLLVIAVVFLLQTDFTGRAAEEDRNADVNITLVVMTRDISNQLAVIFAGPIKTQRFNVTANLNMSVKKLKGMVYDLTGLAYSEQKHIIYKGQEMDTAKKLYEYNVTDGSRIHVMTEGII